MNSKVDIPGLARRVGRARKSVHGGWPVAIWFLLPSLFGFFVFFLVPLVRAISISFQDFNLLKNEGEYNGIENYETVLGDAVFWNAVKVTAYYVFLNVLVQTIVALALAAIMHRLTKSVAVRGTLLLPWMLPNILVGLLWLFLLDPQVGFINQMLGWFGVDSIAFLASPNWVIPSLAMINTWKFTGYTALLLFAGMQTIPKNLYEASALDGASEFATFRRITLPLLRPTLALVLIISVIGSFQVFDVVLSSAGGLGGNPGDPVNASRVVYLYIFEKGFLGGGADFGEAAAAATVLMLSLLVVTIAQLKMLRAGESDLA